MSPHHKCAITSVIIWFGACWFALRCSAPPAFLPPLLRFGAPAGLLRFGALTLPVRCAVCLPRPPSVVCLLCASCAPPRGLSPWLAPACPLCVLCTSCPFLLGAGPPAPRRSCAPAFACPLAPWLPRAPALLACLYIGILMGLRTLLTHAPAPLHGCTMELCGVPTGCAMFSLELCCACLRRLRAPPPCVTFLRVPSTTPFTTTTHLTCSSFTCPLAALAWGWLGARRPCLRCDWMFQELCCACLPRLCPQPPRACCARCLHVPTCASGLGPGYPVCPATGCSRSFIVHAYYDAEHYHHALDDAPPSCAQLCL